MNQDYNDFIDLISRRYSCRRYSDRKVEREVIAQIVEAARIAPSACNRQPWTFVALDTPESVRVAAECYGRDWAGQVPAYLVACGHHDVAWHRQADNKDHTDVDVAIAVEHICIAAAALGVGSCWICSFDAPRVARELGLPEGVEAVALVALGYPDEGVEVPAKNRKPIEEILKWEKY